MFYLEKLSFLYNSNPASPQCPRMAPSSQLWNKATHSFTLWAWYIWENLTVYLQECRISYTPLNSNNDKQSIGYTMITSLRVCRVLLSSDRLLIEWEKLTWRRPLVMWNLKQGSILSYQIGHVVCTAYSVHSEETWGIMRDCYVGEINYL